MLAGDVGVDALDGDAEVFRQEETEARAIEHSTGAEDTGAVVAGDLEGNFCEHIDGIGNHQDQRVRSDLLNLRKKIAANGGVRLSDVHAGLVGAMGRASGENDDVGAGENLYVVGTFDRSHGDEHEAVIEVENFGGNAGGGGVVEADLFREASDEGGIGNRGADPAGSHDTDFVAAPGRLVTVRRRLGAWGRRSGVGHGQE